MIFGFNEGEIAALVILLFFWVLLYFYYARFRHKRIYAPIYFSFLAVFVFLIFMAKSTSQPYHPLSIFIGIVANLFMVGLFLFWFFSPLGDTSVRIMDKKGRIDFLNIFVVLICYSMVFSIVYQGMSPFLGSISTSRSFELTPEFGKFYVPIITAVLLIVYRVSTLIHSTVWRSINIFSTTTIFAALAFFIFAGGASSLGIELSQPLRLTGTELAIWVLIVSICGILFEWFLYRLNRWWKEFIRHGVRGYPTPEFRGKSVLESVSPIMLIRLITRKERKTAKARKTLHKKDIFQKHPRLTTVTMIGLLIVTGIMIYISTEKVQVKVLVPTFVAHTQIVNENELPPKVEIFTADELEGTIATSYAIRLVNIDTKSTSFSAPERNRYHLVESEEFRVSETGEYLLINLNEGPDIEKIFWVNPRRSRMDYDQTENPQFDYFILSIEAEIYYNLHVFGYENLITFSNSDISGKQKMIHASGAQRDNVKIEPLFANQISIITLNKELSENMEFLLGQTKLWITVESKTQDPGSLLYS